MGSSARRTWSGLGHRAPRVARPVRAIRRTRSQPLVLSELSPEETASSKPAAGSPFDDGSSLRLDLAQGERGSRFMSPNRARSSRPPRSVAERRVHPRLDGEAAPRGRARQHPAHLALVSPRPPGGTVPRHTSLTGAAAVPAHPLPLERRTSSRRAERQRRWRGRCAAQGCGEGRCRRSKRFPVIARLGELTSSATAPRRVNGERLRSGDQRTSPRIQSSTVTPGMRV